MQQSKGWNRTPGGEMKGSGQCCLEEIKLRGNWKNILEHPKAFTRGGDLCPPPPLRITQKEGKWMAGRDDGGN